MLLRMKRNIPDNKRLSHLKETHLRGLGCRQEGFTADRAFGLGLGEGVMEREKWKGVSFCCVVFFCPDGVAGMSKGVRAGKDRACLEASRR